MHCVTVINWCDLLPLKNLVWVKLRDYVIFRSNTVYRHVRVPGHSPSAGTQVLDHHSETTQRLHLHLKKKKRTMSHTYPSQSVLTRRVDQQGLGLNFTFLSFTCFHEELYFLLWHNVLICKRRFTCFLRGVSTDNHTSTYVSISRSETCHTRPTSRSETGLLPL